MPYFGGGSFTGGAITTPITAGDGTAGAPAYAFSGNAAMGMSRNANTLVFSNAGGAGQAGMGNAGWVVAGTTPNVGGFGVTASSITAGVDTSWGRGGTDGALRLNISGGTTAPTISSGFGTSPSVTAGGSNSIFQVNVGTGGAASSGVIAFHGTWTNAPFVIVNTESAQTTRAVATTTQVTLTASAAWTASTLLDVICFSV